MRYLAIDLGDVRTGIASGDDVLRLATPVKVIEASGDALWRALDAVVKEHGPDAIVIGLPLHMDGRESPRSAAVRAFGAAAGARWSLPVHFQDERLTSFDADQRMARSGRTHAQKKAIRDALAACALLEDFLASR
jgi:putative Holliday junction resolvase